MCLATIEGFACFTEAASEAVMNERKFEDSWRLREAY